MNRAIFYDLLSEIESEYKQQIAQEADRVKYDKILLAIFKEHHMPDLPLIRAAIHNGGDSKIRFFATLEKAWRAYVENLITRVTASFTDFNGRHGVLPEKVDGFGERNNLSPAETAWVLRFEQSELEWTFGLMQRLDGLLL